MRIQPIFNAAIANRGYKKQLLYNGKKQKWIKHIGFSDFWGLNLYPKTYLTTMTWR